MFKDFFDSTAYASKRASVTAGSEIISVQAAVMGSKPQFSYKKVPPHNHLVLDYYCYL